jgi:hypothetical protein
MTRTTRLPPLPAAPPQVVEALQALADGLDRAAGPDLVALVLHGGLARGSFRPGESDVNVAVVLQAATPALLGRVAAPLQAALRAARVEPWIVTLGELPSLAELFPSKLLEVQANHLVLLGDDPFTGLAAAPALVRLRAEQALRSQAIRLRRRVVATAGDGDAQARVAAEVARPLAAELAPLLRLAGAHPDRADTAELLAAAARAFSLDAATLAELAAARKAPGAVADAGALLDRALLVVAAAAEVAAAARTRA